MRTVVPLAIALAWPLPAGAAGFSTDRSRVAADASGVFDVDGGGVRDGLTWDAGLWVGGAGRSVGADGRVLSGVAVAVGVLGKAQLALQIPVALARPGAGDLRVAPKLALLRAADRGVDVALVPAFRLPTATEGAWMGDGVLTWAPELALSRAFGSVRIAVDAGYRQRPGEEARGVRVGDELTARVGVAFRPVPAAAPGLETGVTAAAAAPLEEDAAGGVDAWIGATLALSDGVSAFAGGGAALMGGGREGAGPAWQAAAGLRFDGAWGDEPVVRAPPDRDADGVADAADRCPEDAEDADGRFDDDGCPDFDDDGDGVLDVADACPDQAGDPADRGCPPEDTDGDGLADAEDTCPAAPGTFHGCPSATPVRMSRQAILLTEPLAFEEGKAELTEAAGPVLDALAEALKAHGEIRVLRVEGHTDDRGPQKANVALSEARAKAVADGLVSRGIDRGRLQAVGYGPSRPVAPNTTAAGRAENRRVALVVAVAAPPGARVRAAAPGDDRDGVDDVIRDDVRPDDLGPDDLGGGIE